MFSLNLLIQSPLKIIPYLFLALSILSLWAGKYRIIWFLFLLLAILTGLLSHKLTTLALPYILLLAVVTYYLYKPGKHYSLFHILSLIIFVLLSLGLFYHLVPGFHNLLIANQYLLSKNSYPFTLFLNFDKPLVGLFLLAFGWDAINRAEIQKFSIVIAFFVISCALVILPMAAMALNYVKWDPKWNWLFVPWAFNNLIFVCMTEEAFYRGFIQGGLSHYWRKNKFGALYSIIIASILFGLSHFRGGIFYVILSTLAGFFYGTNYAITRRIETSIFTHFLLNSLHFLLFSYPALKI